MGWLGWTEQQTLDTSILSIELAFEGKCEMLKACYGSDTPLATEPIPPTPEHVMSVFRRAAS